MSICRWLPVLLAVVWASNAATDGPRLGEPLDPAAIDSLDLTVLPDGTGLPADRGTVAEGEAIYAHHCMACHGPGGRGGLNDALVGGIGSLATQRPQKTVGSYWPYATTLFDYVRRSMPYQSPGSLADSEIYAVSAYLLHLNGLIAADAVMDAYSLPRVRMPNRDGFRDAYDPRAGTMRAGTNDEDP
jgi:S-disulfanyl-L-cysteine oxidoreductase SoxD